MDLVLVVVVGIAALAGLALALGLIQSVNRTNAWRRIAIQRRELLLRERSFMDSQDSFEVAQLRLAREESGSIKAPGWEPMKDRDLDRYWAVERNKSSILLRLAEIETEAERVLDEELGPRPRQLFQLRAELQNLGIWSADDVATFDRAMAIRNSIVHGDGGEVESASSVSDDDLDRLLARLKRPGSASVAS